MHTAHPEASRFDSIHGDEHIRMLSSDEMTREDAAEDRRQGELDWLKSTDIAGAVAALEAAGMTVEHGHDDVNVTGTDPRGNEYGVLYVHRDSNTHDEAADALWSAVGGESA